MRLAKFLATAGVASRRASEDIVRAGRVAIGGVVITDPARDVTGADAVTIDGQPIAAPTTRRSVYMVHKPAGVVSTASDPQGRPTVVDLVPSDHRLYPVGRLDIDTTGLLLLTDDGPLAHRLTHPSFGVEKTYVAIVRRAPVREATLRALREGLTLEDGPTAPARARLLAPDTVELTLREGRKRQVRRMLEQLGHPVASLQRVRLGPLRLGSLAEGGYRRLADREVALLRDAGGAARPRPDGSGAPRARPRAGSRGPAGARRAAGS